MDYSHFINSIQCAVDGHVHFLLSIVTFQDWLTCVMPIHYRIMKETLISYNEMYESYDIEPSTPPFVNSHEFLLEVILTQSHYH